MIAPKPAEEDHCLPRSRLLVEELSTLDVNPGHWTVPFLSALDFTIRKSHDIPGNAPIV